MSVYTRVGMTRMQLQHTPQPSNILRTVASIDPNNRLSPGAVFQGEMSQLLVFWQPLHVWDAPGVVDDIQAWGRGDIRCHLAPATRIRTPQYKAPYSTK